MELVKSFEQACEKLGYNPETVIPDFSCFPEHHRNAMQEHAELVIITEALNKDVEGDAIWYPVFYKGSPSGWGFLLCRFLACALGCRVPPLLEK